MNNKKILTLLLIITVVTITGCGKEKNNSKYKIVTTNFPCYDFVRAVIKDVNDISEEMLLTPGAEIHDFEPTPQDIIKIKESDIFIYVGGESDEWVSDILSSMDSNTKVIKLMDLVDLYKEELVEGMDESRDEEEYDEHVWTSPKNAITIIEKLRDEIINLDKDNQDKYIENSNDYISKLKNIDEEIKEVVNNSKRKELVFGDRFPLRYFTEEYDLTYHAAHKGCSEATEASSKTIAYLIDYVKNNNIPVIFYIELSNKSIASAISKDTNTTIMEFNSAHNITQSDFDSGITYIDLMKKNIDALRIALN